MAVPLDPLAATTASLLAGAVLGEQDQPDELAGWPDLAVLVARVHQAAGSDPELRASLAAVSATPTDPAKVTVLAHAIAARAGSDAGLYAELERLLGQGRQDPTAGRLVTQIAGHAQVGRVVTIGHAGEVHVHLPPVSPPTLLDQLPPARSGVMASNLPARNRVFTGRADLLARLHQQLTARTLGAVAVTALPSNGSLLT